MVKIGIIGANHPKAGELIRILINHPEADILTLFAPEYPGRNVSSIHHGLIGESSLFFTDKVNPEELDLIFLIENDRWSQKILETADNYPDLKIISLFPLTDSTFELGISEVNRKALVRGAKKAFINHPLVVTSLIPLEPLAKYMLLNSTISIEAYLPQDLISDVELKNISNFISDFLVQNQPSFKDDLVLSSFPISDSERGVVTKITINSSLPLEEFENIYEQKYDDHNFTFVTSNEISPKEVEGTQKNLIQLQKPSPDILQINIIADARLRGGAGDAVHVMNLFFGLHEKTGLSLKPSRF